MMMLHIPRAVRRHEDLVCLNQSREGRPTHRAGADRAAAFLHHVFASDAAGRRPPGSTDQTGVASIGYLNNKTWSGCKLY